MATIGLSVKACIPVLRVAVLHGREFYPDRERLGGSLCPENGAFARLAGVTRQTIAPVCPVAPNPAFPNNGELAHVFRG